MKINDDIISNYFFSKQNKIYRTKLNKLEDTHLPTDLYEYIVNRFDDSKSLKESIYRIKFNYINRPVCNHCGAPIEFLGKPSRMWKLYCCKKCQFSEEKILRYKQTCLERYGVEYAAQSNEFKEKSKQTCLERYGVEHYTNRKKSKQTCLERYGVELNWSIPKIKENRKQTWINKYGVDNPAKSDVIKEKSKQTCLEKYGVKYVTQSNKFKEKSKQTCLEKYGVEYVTQSNEFKEKSKQTCLEKYGVEYVTQSNEFKEKSKQTCLERYGVINGGCSKQSLKKIKQTCLERYGVDSYSKTIEGKQKISLMLSSQLVKEKILNTKRKNHTFNTSKPEENFYKKLVDKYGKDDVIRQYKSDVYPFACDFYIKSQDLYIELQGMWTHGKHAFNPDSKEDILILEQWKEKAKTSKFYKNAIETWTVRDVNKREIAKKNNLNYIEIWKTDEIYNDIK